MSLVWWCMIVYVIIIALTTYLKLTSDTFNDHINAQLMINRENANDLIPFSYDIKFDPPVDSIDITNPYSCTPTELRTCDINDALSCEGCQNLIASCEHFDKDTKYVDSDKNTWMIPANKDSNEGYCLVITDVNRRCNPYHGDLVLVQRTPNNIESLMICECKRPGFIGKDNIAGDCTLVQICGGKIKDINKQFEELECECPDGFTSTRMEADDEESVPVCRITKIEDQDDWSRLNFDGAIIDKKVYDPDIRGNFKGDQLLDPCKRCALTGLPVNGEIIETEQNQWQCRGLDSSCIPIRLDQNTRILDGAQGPDAMIGIKWQQLIIYGFIDDPEYKNIVVLFGPKGNEDYYKLLKLDINERYAIDLTKHQVKFPGSFFREMEITAVPNGECTGNWPTYYCRYYNYAGSDFEITQLRNGNMVNFNGIQYRQYNGRGVPPGFAWNTEQWEFVEYDMNPLLSIRDTQAKIIDFKMTETLRGSSSEARDMKYLYLIYTHDNSDMDRTIATPYIPDNNSLTLITTSDEGDWEKYSSKIIDNT